MIAISTAQIMVCTLTTAASWWRTRLFANNGISNSGDYAIYVAGAASSLNLTGNTFTANRNNRVLVAPGAMTGADVTFVAEDGLESYELMSDFTVPLGITMTVDPGVMVMARDTSVELNVQGHLQAIGLPTQPITFTSAANSGSNQWAGIVFDGTAGGGTGDLDYATVRYGGRPNSLNSTCGSSGMGFNVGVRNVLAGEVRIRNSQIRSAAFNCNFDSHDYGLYVNNSRVTVQNTLFANNGNSNTTLPTNGDFALYASGASTVLTFDGNVVRNNRRGLQLNGVGAQTLRNNVFKDNPLGGVYVAASAQAQLLHTTFTGNGGDAVTVGSGGSAALTQLDPRPQHHRRADQRRRRGHAGAHAVVRQRNEHGGNGQPDRVDDRGAAVCQRWLPPDASVARAGAGGGRRRCG